QDVVDSGRDVVGDRAALERADNGVFEVAKDPGVGEIKRNFGERQLSCAPSPLGVDGNQVQREGNDRLKIKTRPAGVGAVRMRIDGDLNRSTDEAEGRRRAGQADAVRGREWPQADRN